MKNLVLIIAMVSLISCVTSPRFTSKPIQATGTYQQMSTGMKFPEQVGDFKRLGIIQFNEEATNIGVGYKNLKSKIALTFYSYPAPKITSFGLPPNVVQTTRNNNFLDVYERNKQDILLHEDLILVSDTKYELKQGALIHKGLRSSFTGTKNLSGKILKVSSHLYLFQLGNTLYEYRITYPTNSTSTRSIKNFINQLVLQEST